MNFVVPFHDSDQGVLGGDTYRNRFIEMIYIVKWS